MIQQLPVQRPCHEHLAIGAVGGTDLKSPANVARCQRESHLEMSPGNKKKGQAIGCCEEEGERGDPTIINPALSQEGSERFKRSTDVELHSCPG